jgi:urea carboxylase
VRGPGLRTYILFGGGLNISPYLGSGSTFTLGGFGGLGGRPLAPGDVLQLAARRAQGPSRALPPSLHPVLTREWGIRVLYGPHGAPDFFTDPDIEDILSATWKVHHNSNRTGVRLIGPKPHWARRDGGDAGLHPSNIHDTPYAIGAVNFTGDMPIILGPDGPSLGGFVCPFVVIAADLWKLGQLAPGDSVHFEQLDETAAREAQQLQDTLVARPNGLRWTQRIRLRGSTKALLEVHPARGTRPKIVYRRQGDANLLIEYGEMALDLTLRLRVHALMLELERSSLAGVIDVTPGVRSVQIHFDARVLHLKHLLRALQEFEDRLGELEHVEVPSRVVWLPLSYNDPAVSATIERYMTSVRADAPWCPDNIEFIRRINGLATVEEVRRIIFDARYLVMGLGDVYLGAPVAVPLDPRHRLVTTKYNPARTWTPSNVVGIGGAYLCIYGMEGPGGYQLFGRTIQVWNSDRQTGDFREGHPWLLRFFDQIRFFPVTPAELIEWRAEFPHGRRALRIETETFRFPDYQRLLSAARADIEVFQTTRQRAFDAEREAWAARNELSRSH